MIKTFYCTPNLSLTIVDFHCTEARCHCISWMGHGISELILVTGLQPTIYTYDIYDILYIYDMIIYMYIYIWYIYIYTHMIYINILYIYMIYIYYTNYTIVYTHMPNYNPSSWVTPWTIQVMFLRSPAGTSRRDLWRRRRCS